MNDEDEKVEAEEIAGDDLVLTDFGDIPGYLLAPASVRDEARRAFALTFVVSDEGILHPEWLTTWFAIVSVLKDGHAPKLGEIRALKGRKEE